MSRSIIFVDVAFPTAVRQQFTYHAQKEMGIKPGMRVWVPIRNEFSIGMVVQVHNRKPEFKTRQVERLLDETPIMENSILQLTEWIHRFYYCSWGEAIQAALPVGLNFTSEKRLNVQKGFKGDTTREEQDFLKEIEENSYTLKEAEKRWRDGTGKRMLKKSLKRGWLSVWHVPRQKVDYKKEKHWDFADHISVNEILDSIDNQKKITQMDAGIQGNSERASSKNSSGTTEAAGLHTLYITKN